MEKKMGGASPLDKPPCGSRHSPGRRNGGPTRIRSKSILEDFRMKTVTIYTDGACSGNPGPGGWGAILMYGAHKRELSGGEAATTNNRMELTAVIEALSLLKEPCIVDLWSDSKYVIDGLEKGWAKGWKARGWKKARKTPTTTAATSWRWRRARNTNEGAHIAVKNGAAAQQQAGSPKKDRFTCNFP